MGGSLPSSCRKNSVLIRRSVSLSLPVLRLPKESISSMIMIDGLFSLATSNRSLSNLERVKEVAYSLGLLFAFAYEL